MFAMTTKTKKKKERSARAVPAVSDQESPARQRRNLQLREQHASERSAAGKWEAEKDNFAERSIDDLEAFLKAEHNYLQSEEERATRLLANILASCAGAMRDRITSIGVVDHIKSLIAWDEQGYKKSKKRFKKAKKAYKAKTGKKWKPK